MRVRLINGEACILQSSGELVKSDDALNSCSATWFCFPFESAESYAPIVGKTNHPIWVDLYCKSVSIKKHGLGAIITASFEGSESWSSENDSNENTIEVSCTMREEAIETHPDFKTWAGSPEDPNAGGIFDEDGKFTGWNFKTELGKEFTGVKSYLVPSYSALISYVSNGRPSLGGIGGRGGGGGLPSIGGGREWLCTGISYSSIADGKYKVTENYLSSGENGWSNKIYK